MFDCSQHFILNFSCCSLRESQINLWRIRPWNSGFSVFSIFISGLQRLLFVHLLFDSSKRPLQLGGQSHQEDENRFCRSPGAIPGVWVFPWQEGDQSQFIQLEENWNLCLPLSGWFLWSPAFSTTFSIKTRNGAVCTQQKGNNLGTEVCFRRCISGSLNYNGRKAINVNLFQTIP